MKFTKIRDVKSPQRANSTDAGIDFFIPHDWEDTDLMNGFKTMIPGQSVLIPSGIKVNVPEGYALVAFNKSGISTKKGLQVGACVVDCGYQGEVHVHLTNVGGATCHISPGDKIVQFLLLPLGSPVIEEVPNEELFAEASLRGEGGFGSTGAN
jgi:dUTP pyrophosphatase